MINIKERNYTLLAASGNAIDNVEFPLTWITYFELVTFFVSFLSLPTLADVENLVDRYLMKKHFRRWRSQLGRPHSVDRNSLLAGAGAIPVRTEDRVAPGKQ